MIMVLHCSMLAYSHKVKEAMGRSLTWTKSKLGKLRQKHLL